MGKNLLILMFLTLTLPIVVLAQTTIIIENPLKATTTEAIINSLIDLIFKIAIVLVPLMIIYAGFLFVTAGGNLEQVTQAKRVIMWTIIGLVVVLLSKGIMSLIETILGIK